VKPPIFRPAAAADVEDAYRWYEDQRAGLGDEFLAAVSNVVESLVAYPERFPIVYRQTRRVLLHRFPYSLFYRIIDDQIIVVACMHGRLHPRRWQSRS
jgi:plasmid stabilization system protein ParE